MISMLKNWSGEVDINGIHYISMSDVKLADLSSLTSINIVLHSKHKKVEDTAHSASSVISDKTEYKVIVKEYMTKHATPQFDFMSKWNNDNPMPLRTMTGTIEKETKGMVYMKLHGQAEDTVTCMRCHRQLTNPISKLYGIGPECINHVPFIMDLDINDVDAIKQKLVDVTWEGWLIKSAIIEKEKV